jgi:hypothetical protein
VQVRYDEPETGEPKHMTSVHYSENVVRDQAKTAAKKKSRKYVAIGAAAAVLGAGGAAWAAVQLFGFGDADVAATTVQNLSVDNIATTDPLLPGETVGATGIVHNPNNFPVKVTGVIIREVGLEGVGAGCNAPGVLIPQGVYGNYGAGIGNGWKTTLAAPIPVAKNNGAEWVSIQQAVKQQAGTTMLCGFKAKIAVTAEAGS